MPDVRLYGGFSEEEYVREIHITGGSIRGIDQMQPDTELFLKNVEMKDETEADRS